MLDIFTKSRDGLYEATGSYCDGKVTVFKGSKINLASSENFKPSPLVAKVRSDETLVDKNGVVKENISFDSLSTAACFVTGRTANGMITWKTADGKYVRHTLKSE